MISREEALKYEISSRYWVSLVSNPFLQNIVGSYFAWKVRRKYKTYKEAIELMNRRK